MAAAIYVDLENLNISNLKYDDALELVRKMVEQISTCPLLDERVIFNGYVSYANTRITMLRNILKDFGIKLIVAAPLEKAPKKPNLVDFKLYADVLELAMRSRRITTIALASADSDYGFLCESIKRMGKQLVLVTRDDMVGQSIIPLCDDWVNVTGEYGRVNIPYLWHRRLPPEKLRQEAEGEACLRQMLQRITDDRLLNRLIQGGLIHMDNLRVICEAYAVTPDYRILGLASQIQYYAHLLRGLPYCLGVSGERTILYPRDALPADATLVETPTITPAQDILAHAAGLPDGYTHEKAGLWRQYFKENADMLGELRAYMVFFESAGVLRFDGGEPHFLPKSQYKQAVLSKLDQELRNARCAVPEDEYKAFAKNL